MTLRSGGRALQKVKLLKDESDLPVACGREGVVVGGRIDAVRADTSAIRAIEQAENVEERRFAGSRAPHDRHELAAVECAGSRLSAPRLSTVALPVSLGQILRVDHVSASG